MTLGQKVKEARLAADLTQTQLAGRVGIDTGRLSLVENGKAVPSLAQYHALIRELGLDPVEMSTLALDAGGVSSEAR